jgi:hypothetical protein
MTQPYTEAEVNAAVAATVDELRATIEKLQGRVGELETFIRERVADRSTMCVKRGGGYHARRICLEAEKILGINK